MAKNGEKRKKERRKKEPIIKKWTLDFDKIPRKEYHTAGVGPEMQINLNPAARTLKKFFF